MPHALHWVLSSPSPYNAGLFAALAADPAIDLTVHYYAAGDPGHFWRRPHGTVAPGRFAQRRFSRVLGLDREILRIAADRRSRLVVAGWNVPALWALLGELALLGRPYLFFTDTPRSRRRSLGKRAARAAAACLVFRTASAVLATGKPATDALQAMGCRAEKLVNFPYFCDIEALRRPSAAIHRGPLRLTSCGRLVPGKGYDTALRAVAAWRRAAGAPFRYDLAGAGPEEGRLRALADQLGIGEHVRFRGWLEADDAHVLLRQCDIFLHTATAEPYGVAVLEAMAAGAAVLASEATGAARGVGIIRGLLDGIAAGVRPAAGEAGD